MIARQCAHTFPHSCIVWCGDALFIARFVCLPNFHRSIITARCQSFAIFIERNAPHRRLMSIQRVQTWPIVVGRIFCVQFDCVIVTGRSQNICMWMPFNSLHILLMCIEYGRTFKFIVANHFPNPHRFIATTCRQQMSRLWPWHTLHFVLVSFQCGIAFEFTGFFIPNRCGRIETGRRKKFPVPRPGNTTNRSCMSIGENCFCFPFVIAFRWPNSNGFIFAATEKGIEWNLNGRYWRWNETKMTHVAIAVFNGFHVAHHTRPLWPVNTCSTLSSGISAMKLSAANGINWLCSIEFHTKWHSLNRKQVNRQRLGSKGKRTEKKLRRKI